MWVSLMIMVKLLMMVVVLKVMFSNMGMNLMGVAFVSLESMQLSVGPQTVGVWGVLQLFAYEVKLLTKELILSNHANTIIFLLALAGWADMNMGMLYLFAVSSLGAYAVLCSGWANNSQSSFLGALSASFDCVEAESELVSGFHTEYSALLFFLSEYGHVILMSYFNVLLFWGGWLPIINLAPLIWTPKVVWLGIKVFLFLFIWTRASILMMSFDNLMHLGWKSFLSATFFIS